MTLFLIHFYSSNGFTRYQKSNYKNLPTYSMSQLAVIYDHLENGLNVNKKQIKFDLNYNFLVSSSIPPHTLFRTPSTWCAIKWIKSYCSVSTITTYIHTTLHPAQSWWVEHRNGARTGDEKKKKSHVERRENKTLWLKSCGWER